MSSLASGARLAAGRLYRPGSAAVVVAATLFVALDARLEHRAVGSAAADDTLLGAVFGICVPLVAYLVVERVLDGRRLDDAMGELSRYGTDRRSAALGALLVPGVVLAAVGAGLALLGALLAQGRGGASDAITCAGIGAFAGAAYAAWFGAASTLGRRGGGRVWALVLDWLLGSGTTALALPWPRGHVRNLLGAEPVLGLPVWNANGVLAALALVCLGVALARTAR